jgi:transposase
MLKPRSTQASFYGLYLYDKIVPIDHLLRKINQVVDFSFVNDLVKDKYTPDFGRPAEDPEFMLRLCLLQYLYGDSDRGVIENARMNLGYKYFLGLAVDEEPPDDTTISFFRAQRLGEEKFRQIFEQIVRQCKDKGLVKGQRQIIDSTHIIADMAVTSLTGLLKLCRHNVLETVEKQNSELAEKLGLKDMHFTQKDKFTRMADNLEDEIIQAEKLLDNVAQSLKDKRLKVTPELQKDLGLLEKAVADRDDKARDRLVSPVDPDARAGHKQHKQWVGYKGHLIVEEESEIITAVDTTPGNQIDSSQFKSLLDQQETAYSLTPDEISGDKGYDTVANLESLEAKQITGYISLTKKTNAAGLEFYTVDDFLYDPNQNTLMCPACQLAPLQRRAVFHSNEQVKRGTVFEFKPEQCQVCSFKPQCYKGNRGRSVYISYYEPLFRQMKERMASEEGKAAYRNRYKVEHKIADLARWCGMRRCRYRGLVRAGIHTLLSAIVSNVKRMTRLVCPRTGKACPILLFEEQNSVMAS